MDTLIVTGAGRGIGAAVARLAAKQFVVAVNFVKNKIAAQRVVDEINSSGGRALAIQGDVGRESDILNLFETAERKLGPIGALVNNAGITGGVSKVENLTSETLNRVLAVNLTGTVLCCREAVRRMQKKNGGHGGSIVNLSSIASRIGGAGEWVHYAMSKGAIDSFTIGLAREVAAEGIRVNAVSPGLIETDLHADSGQPDRLARLVSVVPMKRTGSAAEVAEGVMWLLSPSASYVTGTILEISGGR